MRKDIIIPAKKELKVPLDLKAAVHVVAGDNKYDTDEIHVALVRAAESITQAAESILTTTNKVMADKMQPELKRLSKVRTKVKEIHETAAARSTDVRDRVDQKLAELEANVLPAPPRSAVQMIYAAECRSNIRETPQENRMKVLRDRVEASDEDFIGAVISGAPALTGMSPTEIEMVRAMWRERHHADTVERTRKLHHAKSQLDRVSRLFDTWSGSIHADKQAEIEAAEAAAKEADEALQRAS